MRYATLAALLVLASAVPALAQDRTPPAGSLLALEPPVDVRQSQLRDPSLNPLAPLEGRSVFTRPAFGTDGDQR